MFDLDLVTRWWVAIAALIFAIDRLSGANLEGRVKSVAGSLGGNAITFLYAGTLICAAFSLKDLWQQNGGGATSGGGMYG
jgi:hypothetical protein